MARFARFALQPHARRWLAAQEADLTCENQSCQAPAQAQLVCHPEALPFAEASIDLLVLPHTLERCQSPHAAVREVARVLVPEGRVLIFGLNRWSVWGAQHRPGAPSATQCRPGFELLAAARLVAIA